jgi:predicted acylesterase/phospholipase RssA
MITTLTTIKHLVLSGGGIWGLSCYGALRESAKSYFWNIESIESIHATSVGSVLAVMLALKYEWDTLDDFLIKRPWGQVFPFNLYTIVSSVDKRGIFEKGCIYDMFTPLFKGKDLSLNITMKEFYDLNGINIHCYSTEINNDEKYTKVDFSHTTHPDWKLLDVIYCSCCLPILFSPYLEEDKCYVDGAVLNNYPLASCMNTIENPDEIFGIKKASIQKHKQINTQSSIFDFLLYFIMKGINSGETGGSVKIKNELEIKANAMTLYDMFVTTSCMEERIKLIQYGSESWTQSPLMAAAVPNPLNSE